MELLAKVTPLLAPRMDMPARYESLNRTVRNLARGDSEESFLGRVLGLPVQGADTGARLPAGDD